jgi:hypothetical protein
MGNEMPEWAKQMGNELLKAGKQLFRLALKICLVLFILLVISWVVIFFMAKSVMTKVADPSNREVATFASMVPLVCSSIEYDEQEEEIDELTDFLDTVTETKSKCGSSMTAALNCYKNASEALDEPITYVELYDKGKRLYKAQDDVKRLVARNSCPNKGDRAV